MRRSGTARRGLRSLLAALVAPLLGLAACEQAASTAANAGSDASGNDVLTAPATLRALNYNVMCSFCKFKAFPHYEQSWAARLPWLRDVLSRHDADIIGVQELQSLTLAEGKPSEFEQLLPTGFVADWYREQPGDLLPKGYPDAAIAWRDARFSKVDQGWFWLSPTPEAAYSAGFASSGQLPRIVFWVELRERAGGRPLVVVNTHFDNNPPSQEKSAPLLLERLTKLVSRGPLLVLGDFNTRPGHPAYEALVGGTPALHDTFDAVTAKRGKTSIVVSNVEPAPLWDESDRIDHVLWHSSPGFDALTPTSWHVDLYRYGALIQPPSDHPGAVVVDFDWP